MPLRRICGSLVLVLGVCGLGWVGLERVSKPSEAPPPLVFTRTFAPGFPPSFALVIVEIRGKPEFLGSGFLVDDKRGLVSTAAHVARAGEKDRETRTFRVFLDGRAWKAKVLSLHPENDSARLHLDIAPGMEALLPIAASRAENSSETGSEEVFFAYGCTTGRGVKRNLFWVYYNDPSQDVVCWREPLELVSAHAAYTNLSVGSALEALRVFTTVRRGRRAPKPEEQIYYYEDFFVFQTKEQGKTTVGGFSGGPITDKAGKIIAFTHGASSAGRVAGVPITEVRVAIKKKR